MTPHTIHRLFQDIKCRRQILTQEETWLQKQPKSEVQGEAFRVINHKRKVLKYEESLLVASATE